METIKDKYEELKTNIQYNKAKKKIELLYNYINNIYNYNNTDEYDNYKNFRIEINYYCDELTNNTYNYNIKVYRGLNDPSKCFENRLSYKERLDDLIGELGEKLMKNENFSYSSYQKNMAYNSNELEYSSFTIHLKKGVSINFIIKTKEDLKIYKSLEQKYFKNKVILSSDNNLHNNKEEIKDKIQLEKAKKILKNVDELFESIYELNSIEDYINKKEYILSINNYYDNRGKFYNYDISILRGSTKREPIYKTSIKLKNKTEIYEQLYKLLERYSNKKEFLYSSVSNELINEYSLRLKNNITLNFGLNDDLDRDFYMKFNKSIKNNLNNEKELVKKGNL